MTTSKPKEAYVWIWLPEQRDPVVAGKIYTQGKKYHFIYGQRYLERSDAISLNSEELPLSKGGIEPLTNLDMPGCLRDASPDAWGRRVIIHQQVGGDFKSNATMEFDELTYLLQSGSDRIGMLDFQRSATDYEPRTSGSATIEELMDAAFRIEKGLPIAPALEKALLHGSSIGGARPKSLIETGSKKYIAKFSSSNDIYSVVKAEFIAMQLAGLSGIDVAPTTLEEIAGRDVLLIERFDRMAQQAGWTRKGLLSALTLLKLNEMEARYASYADLAEIIRLKFDNPKQTLKELFSRIIFNILCGNTDDHARNHAAFWDGHHLKLTPAYDLCPQNRSGQESSQAMTILDNDNLSRFSTCLKAAHQFLLTEQEAEAIILHQVTVFSQSWPALCEAAALNRVDRNLFIGRQFLNPYSYQDLRQSHPTIYDACVTAIEGMGTAS